jgi:hypothetical protein
MLNHHWKQEKEMLILELTLKRQTNHERRKDGVQSRDSKNVACVCSRDITADD